MRRYGRERCFQWLVGVNKLVTKRYTTLKHRKAESTISVMGRRAIRSEWEVEGGLSFLLNCEASPRVRKIVLASSASKLYLDGSLAVSGGERGLGRIRTIDCVLAQGCPIFGLLRLERPPM